MHREGSPFYVVPDHTKFTPKEMTGIYSVGPSTWSRETALRVINAGPECRFSWLKNRNVGGRRPKWFEWATRPQKNKWALRLLSRAWDLFARARD